MAARKLLFGMDVMALKMKPLLVSYSSACCYFISPGYESLIEESASLKPELTLGYVQGMHICLSVPTVSDTGSSDSHAIG